MSALYPYLVSSLPMLHFRMKLPFSFEEFLLRCEGCIPERDCALLRALPKPQAYAEGSQRHSAIAAWVDFDTALRNSLVRVRAPRRHREAASYLRPDGYQGLALEQVALAAQRSHSAMEGEQVLDQARWNMLEELSFGHYFDLDFLILYAYKLILLERWEKVHTADSVALLDAMLTP